MKQALLKTLSNLKIALPMIGGIFLLVNLVNPLFTGLYNKLFTGNFIIDPLAGAMAGSISFGIPLTSYVIGGELLKQGVSLIAITAFLLTWSTVGVVMLPLEAKYLGRRFAVIRNAVNFLMSIIIAIITVISVNLLNG